MLCRNLDLCSLPLRAAGRLMNHDLCIRKGETFPFLASRKQKSSHTGCHSYADSRYITLDILHCIIDSHPRCNGASRAVNVQLDILLRVIRLKEKHLGYNYTCRDVAYLFPEENNSLLEQS